MCVSTNKMVAGLAHKNNLQKQQITKEKLV